MIEITINQVIEKYYEINNVIKDIKKELGITFIIE